MLLPEAQEIIALVVEKSGKEIDFQLIENLYVDSLVRMARANMPCHILMIRADQSRYVSETIAHECGHVLRLLSVAPFDRKVSCSTSLHVSTAKSELEREPSSLPPEIKNQMLDTWINGLVLQVNNLPVDVRIEITNEWAKILGLSDWYSWTDFENVPQGMYYRERRYLVE